MCIRDSCFVVCLELPFAVVVEFLPAEELVVRNNDGVLQRQRKRVCAVQMLAVGADDVIGLRVAGVDECAVENIPRAV